MTGRPRRWGIALGAAVGLAGCLGSREPPSRAPHYEAWHALVDAAWHGDLRSVGTYATAMDGGEAVAGVAGAGGDAEAAVGGALGFLRVARDPEELATGVARAAIGCGRCHAAEHVTAPPAPPCTHATFATWALDALLWHRPGGPPSADLPEAVRSASGASDAATRVAAVLATCAGCHAAGASSGSRSGSRGRTPPR